MFGACPEAARLPPSRDCRNDLRLEMLHLRMQRARGQQVIAPAGFSYALEGRSRRVPPAKP